MFSRACVCKRVAICATDFDYCNNKTRPGFGSAPVEIGSRGSISEALNLRVSSSACEINWKLVFSRINRRIALYTSNIGD